MAIILNDKQEREYEISKYTFIVLIIISSLLLLTILILLGYTLFSLAYVYIPFGVSMPELKGDKTYKPFTLKKMTSEEITERNKNICSYAKANNLKVNGCEAFN